jgi:predicted component of type VI protein secretion system
MTYTEDMLRFYQARIETLESRIQELEAQIEINQNQLQNENR